MGNISSALQELRADRKQAQLQVEKLDQAISVIESLNGSGGVQQANRPTRVISAASRRKMAEAQRARWAKARKESQTSAGSKDNGLSSCETYDVSSSPEEDCGVSKSTLGENESSKQKAA